MDTLCRRCRRAGWLLCTILLAVPLPVSSAPALPDARQPFSLEPQVRELSAWLAARTDYREPPIPGILFESQSRLQQRCFPDFPEQRGTLVKGAYDPAEKIIYLDTEFESDDLVDRSYLLHELVHHFQVHNAEDIGFRTRGILEGEAYRLQLRWLREAGVSDPLVTLGIDERTLLIIDRCPR
ncbi:DUF6647 family protein [Halomonas sp.]|uniref:DUF6647 family protein n=1 Tax=Halomonas sp. TaxID=1486246 RepID=UPI00298E0626|nr:DUF6647 family protein [Halomonas sp.]MDW7746455.1 DUF6647 family protein [Halomonas sp.]